MSKYHTECTGREHKKPKEQKNPDVVVTNEPKREERKDDTSDLLAVLNADRTCSCEVTARAVRADVAKYIGLSERRTDVDYRAEHDTLVSCSKDKDPNSKTPDETKKSPPPPPK